MRNASQKVVILRSLARNTRRKPRLPKFKPIRLEKLLKDGTIDEAAVELRSKINRQQRELLAAIGLDPDTPKLWERAFFLFGENSPRGWRNFLHTEKAIQATGCHLDLGTSLLLLPDDA
jgi:hypothetical protein